MGRVTSPMFIGRVAELAALDDALGAAAAGQATTILIEGEPGVGKSRLLQAWNERATKRGARIAAGSCLDLGETGPAYTAIIEALRELIRDFGPGEDEGLAGPDRLVLARIVPELGPARDAEAPGSSLSTLGQTRLFERLVDVLRGAATIAPVVVELEDIHWADQSSQAFLLYLVEAARGAHLLLLCTYRPEAADTSAAFRTTLGQLLRRQGVATMPLMPFDAEELRQQLTGILGRPPSTALLNAIRARSEGNPLFTEELAAARDPNVDLPASIGAATAARVGTLSPNARSVLRVASVVGRTATYDVLREVTSLSDDDLADALREAVQVRLIEPIHDREAYRFRHALLQEAIYGETLPGERRRLHAAVANALWDDPDRPPDDADLAPRLARHWLEAREYPRAFLASRAAATAAEQQAAYAEAATHCERLLELWDRAGQATAGLPRAATLEHAAWVAFLAGEVELSVVHGQEALAELERTPDERLHIRVLDRLAWTLGRLGQDYEPPMRSLAAIDPEGRPMHDRLMIQIHRARCIFEDQPSVALDLAREALDAAESANEAALFANAAGVVAGIQQMHDPDASLRVLERARRLGTRAGDDVTVADMDLATTDVLLRDRRYEEALSTTSRAIEFAGRAGLGRWAHPYLRYVKSECHLRLGQLDEALVEIELALADAPTGRPLALLSLVAALASIGKGAYDEAATHIEASRLPHMTPEAELGRGWLAAVRAQLALGERRWADAEGIVEATAPLLADEPMYTEMSDTMWPLVEAGFAAVAERVEYERAAGGAALPQEVAGTVSRLTGYVEAIRRQRERTGFPDLGQMHAYEALIAGHLARIEGRDAPGLWASAAEAFPPRSLEALTARYRQGEAMLSTRTSHDEVAAIIASAHGVALEIGALPLADRFKALARRARVDLRQTVGTLPAQDATGTPGEPVGDAPGHAALRNRGLSDREIDVLALVAAGLSNQQIGDRLFITRKTASVHVTHILDKLDVSTRTEAATIGVRLGLPEVALDDR